MAIFGKKPTPEKKKKRNVQLSKVGHSIKVVDVDHLLASKHHRALLDHTEQLSQLEGDHYNAVYDQLTKNFAAYVQVVPSKVRGGLSGLLNESLFSAYYNLKALDAEKKDSADALFRYAAFSASLLRRVAHVVERFRVVITDDKGHYVKEWDPFASNMIEQNAGYYKLFPLGPLLTTNHAVLMGMVVHLLMPKEGLDWLRRDPELFHEWLNAMEVEEGHLQGRLAPALVYILREDADFLLDALPDILVDQVATPDTTHGEAFYSWLRRGLEDQSIGVNGNDAMVHIVNNGLFIEFPGLVRDFVTKVYAVPVNFNVVFQQFGNLFGLVKLGGMDFRHDAFFSDYPGTKSMGGNAGIMSRPASSLRQGIVVNNPHNFYLNGEVPPTSKHMKAADHHTAKTSFNALPTVNTVLSSRLNSTTGGRRS